MMIEKVLLPMESIAMLELRTLRKIVSSVCWRPWDNEWVGKVGGGEGKLEMYAQEGGSNTPLKKTQYGACRWIGSKTNSVVNYMWW